MREQHEACGHGNTSMVSTWAHNRPSKAHRADKTRGQTQRMHMQEQRCKCGWMYHESAKSMARRVAWARLQRMLCKAVCSS